MLNNYNFPKIMKKHSAKNMLVKFGRLTPSQRSSIGKTGRTNHYVNYTNQTK